MSLHFDFQNLAPLAPDTETAAKLARDEVQARKAELGFTQLPYADISNITSLAAEVAGEVESVIVIGIGGSDLGARAVHRALNHQFYNFLPRGRRGGPQLFFLGDTTDPVAIQEVVDVVDMAKTAVVIISKSGNTIEQMSTFVYLRSLGPKEIIVVTDAEKGTLREIIRKDGYRNLSVPANVGGRFSVLSSVGLFVLALTGINVQELLAGARWLDEHTANGEQDAPLRFAAQQWQAMTQGQPISVLMPYAYSLREFGFWYRQLWAESLGKRLNRAGEVVNVGPTPIAAVGPTDQHSQLQLYREGPKDKIFTFIAVEEPAKDMELPGAYPELEGVAYLKGHHFGEILSVELASTAAALADADRPSSVISISKLDAFHLGALIYFFELATAYSAELYDVDAYSQPGVELSKDIMYGMLERPGYEKHVQTNFSSSTRILLR